MTTIDAVPGDRKSSAFTTEVLNWRFVIRNGPRDYGVISRRTYKTVEGAHRAGEKYLKNLTGQFQEK